MLGRQNEVREKPVLDDDGACDPSNVSSLIRFPHFDGNASKGMTVLVVDDHPVSRIALRGILAALGHEVVVASDGAEAWCLIQRRHFDIVFTDWMMPKLNGLNLCHLIRELIGRAYTYIVMITSRNEREDRVEALDAGADDYLCKPIHAREMVARLGIAQRLITMQDELARKNAELQAQATTDVLTGLRNRRFLFEALESNLALAARQRSPLSLILVDVDNFKEYNDTFGHPAGDEVLRLVASELHSITRSHDTVARYGGEEFAILLPWTGPTTAVELAERLRGAIEQKVFPQRSVTASFGVATAHLGTGLAGELVTRADLALYGSKRRGRNRVTHQDFVDAFGDARSMVNTPDSQQSFNRLDHPNSVSGDRKQELALPPPSGVGSGGRASDPDNIVEGLSRALALRDCDTENHSHRVTSMTLVLARALGIADAEMPHIRHGAMLHDIGKIGIPDAILQKPGPLTDEEWVVMKRHPQYARELLAPFEFLRPALDIPYSHHERWDGTGYPRGLKGDEIPLAARAFAAVDVWDALSHDRPYRKAWPADRVNAHIKDLSGTHLDPIVVQALRQSLVANG